MVRDEKGYRKQVKYMHCMHEFWDKNLNYQLRSTEQINLTVLAEIGHEIKIDFSGKLHNKEVTGDTYILIGIDWCTKGPLVRICKPTEAVVARLISHRRGGR